jgi:hypothetical protein
MAQLWNGYLVPKGAQSLTRLIELDHDKTLASAQCVDKPKEADMAKGEQRGNRETKKPKKPKIKTIAAAPSQKGAGWQPNFSPEKKK